MTNGVILYIEDNDDDFYATERAFKKSNCHNQLVRCEDGETALQYLFNKSNDAPEDTKLPSIILLDLNLPGTNGREVLRQIKSSDELKNIPVIVLTTSDDKRDIEECYNLGSNSYIQKPVDFEKFIDAVQLIKNYWFEVVILPKKGKGSFDA